MSNVKELLDAGVHFGHQTRRWNPKMREFIFEARNGIHIIDLVKTASQIETAAEFLKGIVSKGGKVLLVGTKKQAQATIRETAEAPGQPYVCERWLGGMMTNLNTIKRSIKRMLELEAMESDGKMAEFVMQEQSMLRRELSRLHLRLNGIRDLSALRASRTAPPGRWRTSLVGRPQADGDILGRRQGQMDPAPIHRSRAARRGVGSNVGRSHRGSFPER